MDRSCITYLCFLLVVILGIFEGAEAKRRPKGVTVIEDLTGGVTCEKERYYCAEACDPPPEGLQPYGPGDPLYPVFNFPPEGGNPDDPDSPHSPDDVQPYGPGHPSYPVHGGDPDDPNSPDALQPYGPGHPDYPIGGVNPDDPNSPDALKPYGPGDPLYPLFGFPYIEIVSTAVNPLTIYLNENNDVTVDMDIQYNTPFTVAGTNLWEASLWFSKFADGSGKTKTNLIDATLTDKQKNRKVKPDKSVSFLDLDQNVDLSDGSSCGKYKYVCGEIRKDNPNPDFELVERTRFSSRGCAKVTCKERGSGDPKAVQFESVAPTGVQLYLGEKNKFDTDVTVTFNEGKTDPTTAGDSLWQMSMWFSKDENGAGSVTGLVESALTNEQASKPVDDFNDFVLENVPSKIDLRDAANCGKYKYICARMRKGNPEPDYQLLGKNKGTKTGCAPVKCKVRGAQDDDAKDNDRDRDRPSTLLGQEPESVIEVVSTTTTPVTLYLNEVNDVTTDVDIVFDTDVNIKGTDLWEMSIWFSKLKDGSGKQTNLRETVLSPRQRNKSVKPDKPLTYVELPQSVDLSDGTGCGKFKYICSKIRKHNPTPDFKLRDRQKDSRRGCARVTCSARENDDVPTVQFRSTQPTPVTLYIGENNDVTTDVDVKFKERNTDPNTAGEGLWQMSLWFSKSENGGGSSKSFVKSALNEDQGSKPVDFDNFMMEQLPITADLTDALGCGKYKYICSRIRKDNPEPDYELVGKDPQATTGCAPVTCETRGPDEQKLEIVSTQPSPVTLYRNEPNDVTTDVTVAFDADYGASGKNLWQMSLWFSKQADGSGKKTNFRESVLNKPNRNKPLHIEEPLLFEDLPQSVDLSDGTGCGKFKYICSEIRKYQPEPNFDFTLKKKNSKIGCARVTCIVREKTTPTVQFEVVEPTPVTLYLGERNEVTTDVFVEFNRANTDEDVSGKLLWNMAVWFSKSKVGAGSSTGEVESALNKPQKNQDVDFSDFQFTELEMTADLRSVGCGKYRFICARIRKNDPSPDYNLVGPKTVSGCAPVTCEKRGEPDTEPLIIVSTSITPVTLYIGEELTVFPDVTVEFEGEEGVFGTNLWEMTLFFTKNGDGSGKATSLSKNTLTQNQKNQPLDITESLVFEEIEKDVDMTVVTGCGKYKYICAEIRKNNPSPNFDFKKKKGSSTRGCAKTSCEVRSQPEPTVQFASTQPTGVTVYLEELNVVNTDVVVTFNEQNTDPTVAGTNLWQMQLWFSKSDSGSGSSSGLIASTLSEEQTGQSVNFNDFSFAALEARADLTTVGCGKFQYICARVRRDKPDPSYELVGKSPAATTGCAPVLCERGRDPTVQFASVTNTPVTVYEESETTVTTTVTVTFDEENTDESVSGNSLWQVTLWFSKAEDGLGSSSDATTTALSTTQASKPVNFNSFVFEDLEITADLRSVGCGKYRYICAQIRRDDPNPTYKLLGKERDATVGCSEVTCDRALLPTVEFASVSATGVTIYEERENPVTTTVSVTFNEGNTDPTVSGSNLWQVNLWFSKAADGLGSSSDAVGAALSSQQAAKPVNFNNFVYEDLEITADLTSTGCGKYRFICAQIRKDAPEPPYNLLGKSVASRTGCAPVSCERALVPTVEFASVSTTGVAIYEEQENPVTTTVSVTFNEGNTDPTVSGSDLWQVSLWFSKADDGLGSSSDGVEAALSSQQAAKPVNFNSFVYEDLEITADLTSTGCGKYRFICAQIRKSAPEPPYELLGKSATARTGCAPVSCERARTPSVMVVSVTNTPVSISPEENNRGITTDVTVTFNGAETDPISGSGLWRLETYYSKSDIGKGSRSSENTQALSSAQINQALSGNSLQFNAVRADADLSGVGCGKYLFICAKIKKGEPNPDYEFQEESATASVGCSPVECETVTVETPHITPVSILPTSTAVTVGERNTIDIDVSIDFDPSNTDDVSGRNLWKIIVWLSDQSNGLTGSRISETEQTITTAQKAQSLSAPGPLVFTRVRVDMDLTSEKCKKIAYVCARLKKESPDPKYTMDPKSVTGCAPCECN